MAWSLNIWRKARFLRRPGGLLSATLLSCPVSVQLFPVIRSLSHWAESPEQAGPLRPRGQCGGGEHSDGGLDPPGSSASPLFKGLSGSVTLISKA